MSNKLFGTDGVRGIAGKYPLSADFAYNLACVLSKKVCLNKKKVVIGKIREIPAIC